MRCSLQARPTAAPAIGRRRLAVRSMQQPAAEAAQVRRRRRCRLLLPALACCPAGPQQCLTARSLACLLACLCLVQERTLMQRLGQSFNSAGIALFARVALVRHAVVFGLAS